MDVNSGEAAGRSVDEELSAALGGFLIEHGERLPVGEAVESVTTLARANFGGTMFCLVCMPCDEELPELTAKQREIALLIAKGLPNKEVARQMGVSPATIASHLVRIYRKMKVDTRAALASKVSLIS